MYKFEWYVVEQWSITKDSNLSLGTVPFFAIINVTLVTIGANANGWDTCNYDGMTECGNLAHQIFILM